jgi:hypothetical protein
MASNIRCGRWGHCVPAMAIDDIGQRAVLVDNSGINTPGSAKIDATSSSVSGGSFDLTRAVSTCNS